MGGGRESQEGGAICILTANRYCCTAETNTILSPWDFLGKNTGVGSHFFSPGNLPNSGMEPRPPALQADSLPSEPPGKL